jgi:transcriptional regulator with XRE-family HTH domain
MKIGNRLLTERQDRKLNQAEMSDLLGLAPSTYSRIERNEGSVNLEQILDFSQKLNIPIQDFLPETISVINNGQQNA